MDYNSLLKKIETYKKEYSVTVIGTSSFGRKIFAVEKEINAGFSTAIFVASTHGREHITTDLVCKMLDSHLFDDVKDFNLSFVLMANPDGVELSANGLCSAPENEKENLVRINCGSLDYSMWKANGHGVDINNNFDANFGSNLHSEIPSPSGYVGVCAESEPETKALVAFTKTKNAFLILTYHSKGEEIYYNFFQTGKQLERDRLIAKQFEKSTGYIIKNVESSSSGGYKDFCVQKLKIPALTIEVGNDELSHPISNDHLDEIFARHKNVADDVKFAYNVFKRFE